MEKLEIDSTIKSVEAIFGKWSGRVPLNRLIEEIERDRAVFEKCEPLCKDSSTGVYKDGKVYSFIDLVIQYHYINGHYK